MPPEGIVYGVFCAVVRFLYENMTGIKISALQVLSNLHNHPLSFKGYIRPLIRNKKHSHREVKQLTQLGNGRVSIHTQAN